MKLAFVVQRYGLDLAGGAEYHCRLVAEHLARHAEVRVLTTCARDYLSWTNHYPAGAQAVNGIPVLRFPVARPREAERFAAQTARVFGERARTEPGAVDTARAAAATAEEAHAWLDAQGPYCPGLVRALAERRDPVDFVVFFSYRYWTTWHGLAAAADHAVLVPTAEDDGAYRLPIFPELFRRPRAIVYNSPEERAMIERASANGHVPGVVVGVGSETPARTDPEGFRRRHGIDGPFLLYVGRVDLNKGCLELAEFFRRYRRETGSALRLVLIGRSVLDLPADDGIVSLGFLPEQEKWDALAACTAFVMPSRLESLSIATLEAFWSEKPVLANARCEVLRGQCRRSNGGLHYATYDEFREALGLLEARPDLRQALGVNGRRYYDRHYTWDVVTSRYLDLFARLGAEARAGAAQPAGAAVHPKPSGRPAPAGRAARPRA
jgi:glycosyltransferase involved in cell wall biosynthesis